MNFTMTATKTNVMEKLKPNSGHQFIKILIPMIILLSIIYLLKSGYKTGQWLYEFIH